MKFTSGHYCDQLPLQRQAMKSTAVKVYTDIKYAYTGKNM